MTDDRKAGIAWIGGSVGAIVTMAVHPVGARTLTPALADHLALTSALAHSLAIVSMLLVMLGAFGVTRRLGAEDRLAFSALVVYAFAAVWIVIATAVSGFIAPTMMRNMVHDTDAARPVWQIAISSIFQINQAFAKMYAVGASVAVALWSASAVRNGGLGKGIAYYGYIVAPLLILGICLGHIQLDVHGMTVIVVFQAIWFIGVGKQMYAGGA